MTGKEFILLLKNESAHKDVIIEIEAKYGMKLPMLVQKIISYSQESIFFENGWRTLSTKDVLEASEDLHVDFSALKILPLFDTGDNDFIVYCIVSDSWAKFNIIDECFFKQKKLLEEYF